MASLTDPSVRPGSPEELRAVAFTESFLRRERERGQLTATSLALLERDLRTQYPAAFASMPPPAAAPVARPAPAPFHLPLPPPAPARVTVPAVRPLPMPALAPRPEPPKWRTDAARWWSQSKQTVRSDLAVNGLAYLGVILLFSGLLGFVIFAFGDVSPWARPVAEVATPATFFLAAGLLRRRGSALVPRLLIGLGAALVPFVVVTAFVDGFALPPDLSGGALQATLGVALTALAVLYAWWGNRSPNLPLAPLAAPVFWLAVTYAASATDPAWHGGRDDVVTPRALQMALVAAAVALTAVVSIRIPWPRLAAGVRTSVLPGILVVDTLAIAAAWGEWPAWPLAVLFIASAVTLEAPGPRLAPQWVGSLQAAFVVAALVAVAPEFLPEWWGVAAMAVMIAVAEFEGWRRPTVAATISALVPAAAGFAVAFEAPWSAVVASSVVLLWVLVRLRWPQGWLPPRPVLVGASLGLPVVIGAALHWAIDPEWATVTVASVVLGVAVVIRATRWSPLEWRWWVPSAAVAVELVTAVHLVSAASVALPFLAAFLAATAVVVAPMSANARAALAVPSAAWVVVLAFEWAEVATRWQLLALAGLGLALTLVACSRPFPAAAVLHAEGLLAATAGAAVACSLTWWTEWTGTVLLAAALGAWGTTAIAEGMARSPLGAIAPTSNVSSADAPPVGVLAGCISACLVPLLAAQTAVGWGEVDLRDTWVPPAVAALGVLEVSGARWLPLRRAQRLVLTTVGFGLSLAVFIADGWGPALAAFGLAVVVVALAPADLRRGAPWWLLWIAAARTSFEVAFAITHAPGPLALSAVVWGLIVVTFALALQRFVPRWATVARASGRHVPVPLLRPPITVGALVAAFGVAVSHIVGEGWGGTAQLLLAAASLLWAVLLRNGFVTVLTWLASTLAFLMLVPVGPERHPWTLVAWAGGVLAVGIVLRHTVDRGSLMGRWYLPAAMTSGAVAVTALPLAATYNSIELTFALAAAYSLVLLVDRREVWWWFVAAGLADVAAAAAGPRWLGLALLVEGVALVAAAVRARDPWNVVLHAAAVAAFGGAWAAFAVGQTGWSYETRWAITAVAAGGCLVICGAVVRARPLWRWWVGAWAALGGIGAAFASFASAGMADPEMLQQWLVLSMLLAAGGAALAATVVPGMRWATIALGACSALWANVGFDPTPAVGVAVSAGIGGLAIASALVRWAQRDDAEWVLPLLALGALAGGAAFFEALEPLPSRGLLVVVLALLAMEFAAVGLTCGWSSCVMVAPVTLVAAWLTYASGAALGDPQWYTVPVGVCVLVDVALVRRLAPNRWRYQLRQALALADVVGMALVVGAALVAAVQGKHWSAALAVLGGTLLATWGAITKVRRRAWFGAATVLVGVTLLLGVPLVRFMRTHEELWSGGAIWLWVAAGGLVAILTATFLEQGRVRVHQAVQKLRDLTSDWE